MAIQAPINMQTSANNQSSDAQRIAQTLHASDLESVFKECFLRSFNTVLCGGANEPLYQPKQDENDVHRIFYRHDYFASALHEIAHWCIAGEARRQLLDFGYWYAEDGRSQQQQAEFEKVEIKPQAIEWAFSIVCNKPFRVSIDNLLGDASNEEAFTRNVHQQLENYQQFGFPPRAQQFITALERFYCASGKPRNLNARYCEASE